MKLISRMMALFIFTNSLSAQTDLLPDWRQPTEWNTIEKGSRELSVKQLDSIIYWERSVPTEPWLISYKTIYEYTNQPVSITITSSFKEGLTWTPTTRTYEEYNSKGKMTFFRTQAWEENQWINQYQGFYTWEDDEYQAYFVYEEWSGTDWFTQTETHSVYDSNHILQYNLVRNWTGVEWVNFSKTTYHFINQVPDHVIKEFWNKDSLDWINTNMYNFTYNDSNRATIYLNSKWLNDIWIPDIRITTTYQDMIHETGHLYENFIGGQFVPNTQVIYTLDANNNVQVEEYDVYTGGMWSLLDQYTYEYDSDNDRIVKLYATWNNEWIQTDSAHYYYNTVSAVESPRKELDKIEIFPNPALASIHVSGNQDMNRILAIYSIDGQLKINRSMLVNQQDQINLAGLSTGTYFAVIQTDHGIVTRTFVKI